MRYVIVFSCLFLFLVAGHTMDNGKIQGRVFDVKNNEPVSFATVIIQGTAIGSYTDLNGNFLFAGLRPGFVQLKVTAIGYEQFISEELMVTNAKTFFIEIGLTEQPLAVDEVKVTANPLRRQDESPVSLRRIDIAEIEKNPGSNRDISKVIQSFPGVGQTVSFRNDLIVRGGGPNENAFFLDDVQIPSINHFSTQGASGGPVGILNVDFIREVNYYSAAFPASRGDALSSVFEFKQRDGNPEKIKCRFTIGASDLAISFDGPAGEKTTYVFSARRSYLQFLFSAIGLPFLPVYNDFQFKTRTKIDDKNEIIFVGLGAYDLNKLNLDANETEDQRYILNYLPENTQWSYTFGGVYKHYRENGYETWVLSRNYLNNQNIKYKDNVTADSLKTLDYRSDEADHRFRYERTMRTSGEMKISYGCLAEQSLYTNQTYRKDYINNALFEQLYNTDLTVYKWGLFGQITQGFFSKRLTLSLGVRSQASDYSLQTNNLLRQVSPRFSASWQLNKKWSTNFNVGRYHQLPPLTALGFKNNSAFFINKINGLKYIASDQFVYGFEMQPNEQSKATAEVFYKWYYDYPFSVSDGVSIASKGGDFGSFGDEEVLALAQGRAYGAEFLYRFRAAGKLNVITSYTLVRSEFRNYDSRYQPLASFTSTSWDNIHLFNITATRTFRRNWDVGAKWRFVGGAPYTPNDEYTSSFVPVWNSRGRAVLDYSRFNDLRLSPFQQLDVRVDKSYFFNRWTLICYLDIQNLYNFKSEEPSRLSIEDENGEVTILNPSDPFLQQRYKLRTVTGDGQGTVLSSIGVIFEF